MKADIEFHGGPDDGRIISSDSPDPDEAETAQSMYFVFTQRGKVGKRFKCMSLAYWERLNQRLDELGGFPKSPDGQPMMPDGLDDLAKRYVYEVSDSVTDGDRTLIRVDFVRSEG